MRLRLFALLFFALLSAVACGPAMAAQALRGVALVIGEAGYKTLPQLGNASRDAQAMARLLDELGFDVTTISDRDAKRLKRDLENFASDAEGADVALVFYSGHAIEAGGENWLVPVDADGDALTDPQQRLVALTPAIEALKANVPLALVFLDACRSNPFPPGAALKLDGSALTISASGLGATRGVIAAGSSAAQQAVGTLFGFAASPGQAALDGPPGEDSPYTAALLRHFAATGQAELGQVMRMVTEEVYLKTRGRQRPWVNESLTGLLYFGGTAPVSPGEDAGILSERRSLLLTIAALPDVERQQVEAAARQAAVPMDALFGLLKALGSDAPDDPEALGKVLAAQADRVARMKAAEATLSAADPEIVRLSQLAAQALADGALTAHAAFWDAATARLAVVTATLDDTEDKLRARRLEAGAVLAQAAQAHALTAEFPVAAQDYQKAFEQVAKWDAHQAWDYKRRAGEALLSQGDEKGDAGALDRAIATLEEAVTLAPRTAAPMDWALSQNTLGSAYFVRAERLGAATDLDRAVAAFRLALEVRTQAEHPREWARTQNNIGLTEALIAERSGDAAALDRAIAAYRAALTQTARESETAVWATLMANLGNALERQGPDHLEEAIAVQRQALAARPRSEVPLEWAASQNNLANALTTLGRLRNDVTLQDQAITAYTEALEVRTRARMPLAWASLHFNLANVLNDKGQRETGSDSWLLALGHYQDSLAVRTLEMTPQDWADSQYNMGRLLWRMGGRLQDAHYAEDAVTALEAALTFYTRSRNETDWAATQLNLGRARCDFGVLTAKVEQVERAASELRSAMEVLTRFSAPLDWADGQNSLGSALLMLGETRHDVALARQAREAVANAAAVYAEQGYASLAPLYAERLKQFDDAIARLGP